GGMGGHEWLLSSVVIIAAADVAVADRFVGGPDVGVKSLVEAVLQDRGDRAVGAGADAEAAQAGSLEADASVALVQPQDAERGAEALLWVRLGAQDRLDQLGGGGTDRGRLAGDPLRRPFGIAPMRARHVLAHRGVPVLHPGAHVRGDALAAVEDLD